ncbi:Uma2 family endonuclease [Streptomyces sp. NPDC058646]|uniref:Uma2 family endonuclease n=1 Tax=Streptomyces sp. NPDC058646 TaxID=3346574 RepID=UPI003657B344
MVVPTEAVPTGENFIPAGAAELVVEITSKSNAVNDRVSKLKGYAAAGIPLHLLIDPHGTGSPTIHLYGEPATASTAFCTRARSARPCTFPSRST